MVEVDLSWARWIGYGPLLQQKINPKRNVLTFKMW
jgi:hypothetical protein